MLFGFQKTWIAFQIAIKQENGQDLVEYGLLGLLVSTAVVGTLSVFGTDLANLISYANSQLFP